MDSDGKNNKDLVVMDVVGASSSHKILHSQTSKDINIQNKEETEALNESVSNLFETKNNETNLNKSCDENIANAESLDKSLSDTPQKAVISEKSFSDRSSRSFRGAFRLQ